MSLLPNGLDTLRFFTGDGSEIQMRKQFSIEWEILPSDYISSAFYRNPRGHIEAGRPSSFEAYFEEISPGEFETIFIEPEGAVLYRYEVSGMQGRQILRTFASDDTTDIVQEVIMDVNAETAVVELFCSADNKMTLYVDSGCTIHTLSESTATLFKCYSSVGEHVLSGRSLKAAVIVDEPGLICPTVSFYREDKIISDFVRYHQKINSANGVVITPEENSWRPVKGGKVCTIDNIYDVIFFGYKYTNDEGETQEYQNKLRLTVNDGKNIATEDYDLGDVLRGSVQTCIEENLTSSKTFEKTDENFFLETADELLHAQTSNDYIFGVKDALFAQVMMTEYEQYDEDLFASLMNFISRRRSQPYAYSD